jgi:hypothetical protein
MARRDSEVVQKDFGALRGETDVDFDFGSSGLGSSGLGSWRGSLSFGRNADIESCPPPLATSRW